MPILTPVSLDSTFFFIGRRPSEFYPSGIRERREIREAQIERMTALRAPVLDTNGVPISNASPVADSEYYHTDNEMVSLEVDGEGHGYDNGNGDANDSSFGDGNSSFDPSKKMRLRAPSSTSIRGWWRWAYTTLRVPDTMVFRLYGIDVWSYLQFMKFCIAVFFVLSIGTLNLSLNFSLKRQKSIFVFSELFYFCSSQSFLLLVVHRINTSN